LANGHPILALRLYDYFLAEFPASLKVPGVERTAHEVLARLTGHDENRRVLTSFSQFHPDSCLTPAVAGWLRLALAA
jgi:hypothetical protein